MVCSSFFFYMLFTLPVNGVTNGDAHLWATTSHANFIPYSTSGPLIDNILRASIILLLPVALENNNDLKKGFRCFREVHFDLDKRFKTLFLTWLTPSLWWRRTRGSWNLESSEPRCQILTVQSLIKQWSPW